MPHNFLPLGVVNDFLAKVGSKFFTVVFRKHTDGTRRQITGQVGVKKGLVGGKSTVAHIENLQVMYVGALQARRSFYKDQVFRIKCGSKTLRPIPRKRKVSHAKG